MTPQSYLFIDNLKRFIGRHHVVIFVTFISLMLTVSIILLSLVLTQSFDDDDTTTSTVPSFNKETIERIKNLHISSDEGNKPLELPSPRPNPFVE